MSLRTTLLAAVLVAAVALVRADDPTPVPAKVDLPPKSFVQEIPGTPVKFDMVYVPGGTFDMGSPAGEPGRNPDEGPVHKVTVRPFWIGKFEVTWDEFDQWWKSEKLVEYPKDPPFPTKADVITRPTEPYVPEDYGHERDGNPAICMSHHGAMMYCFWLQGQTKRGYRLPSEAEWEYACRAGTTGAYSFPAGEKLEDYAWYAGNSPEPDRPKRRRGTTKKPGGKKPNGFGLFDMHGNVAEWCLDTYDAKFYASSPAIPVNVPKDNKWPHVARGGSFKDPPEKLRCAARLPSEVSWMRKDPQNPRSIWWLTEMDQIGFRVLLPADEYPPLVGLKPMVVKKSSHDPVSEDADK